jgi:TRAP-type uncharacterized transport system substrate-binding protein
MAEILSDALKKNQCKGLLRLIASLTNEAGRLKSARILGLADMKGKLLQSGAPKCGRLRLAQRVFLAAGSTRGDFAWRWPSVFTEEAPSHSDGGFV